MTKDQVHMFVKRITDTIIGTIRKKGVIFPQDEERCAHINGVFDEIILGMLEKSLTETWNKIERMKMDNTRLRRFLKVHSKAAVEREQMGFWKGLIALFKKVHRRRQVAKIKKERLKNHKFYRNHMYVIDDFEDCTPPSKEKINAMHKEISKIAPVHSCSVRVDIRKIMK